MPALQVLRSVLRDLDPSATVTKNGHRVTVRCDGGTISGPDLLASMKPHGLLFQGEWYGPGKPDPQHKGGRDVYRFAVVSAMDEFIAHVSSDELYVVTSGVYGDDEWACAAIGMADIETGLVAARHCGYSGFYPVTDPRTLEAWERRMRKINRPDCADVIARALA